jgi:hypothetical protein
MPTPGQKTSEYKVTVACVVIAAIVTGFAIWKEQWAVAIASIICKSAIVAAYSIGRSIVKSCPVTFGGIVKQLFSGASKMSQVATSTVPAPTATAVDTELLALAAKIDSTDPQGLANVAIFTARYVLPKFNKWLNSLAAVKPYLAEVQAAETVIAQQV